jgi:hypothetical protein
MKPITPVLRLALCALTGGPLLARADTPSNIVVRSMASRSYVAPTSANPAAKPATYLFYQGHFYRGATNDPSLQSTTFDQVAHVLAPDLARQGYFPTKDLRQADLLIVVDWGATIGQDNPNLLQEQQNLNDSIAQAFRTSINSSVGQTSLREAGIDNILANDQVFYAEDISADMSMQGTARLLGLKGQFEHALKASVTASNGKSYAEAAIDDELKQDRYFLVVKAYDYQAIRKTGKAGRPLWSTRINLPAEVMAYAQALPAMSHAAAASFGTSTFHFRDKEK